MSRRGKQRPGCSRESKHYAQGWHATSAATKGHLRSIERKERREGKREIAEQREGGGR